MITMSEVQLHNISFKYKESNTLFNKFNFSFTQGDFTFVLGANGSGKSTLLGLVLGRHIPFEGEILFDGSVIKTREKLANLIGYIPQEQSLDGEMTVSDIIDFKASFYFLFGSKLKQQKEKIVKALAIEELLSKQIKKLSGGQKQLVNIALGLIHEPELILLDEPFVGLDFDKTAKLMKFLKELNKTIICITHNIDLAERYADTILLLKAGKIIEQGKPSDIIEANRYVLQEIELKDKMEINLPERVKVDKQQNKISLSYLKSKELEQKLNAFLQANTANILRIKKSESTLQSSIIGLHHISLDEFQKKEKQGGGKGDGTGGGNKKQKA